MTLRVSLPAVLKWAKAKPHPGEVSHFQPKVPGTKYLGFRGLDIFTGGVTSGTGNDRRRPSLELTNMGRRGQGHVDGRKASFLSKAPAPG